MGKRGLILGNAKIKYSINLKSVARKLGLLEYFFFLALRIQCIILVFLFCHPVIFLN